MKPYILYCCLQSAMIVCTSCLSFQTVITPSGPIKGVTVPALGKDIVQFRNIPYAKPPVGNLRFQKPLPVEIWNETLDGTAFGPSCMQNKSIFPLRWNNAENNELSEDCLKLNVFLPGAVSTDVKKTVMFWIHGGGFLAGNSRSYDASFFALKDVIVVTINYRVGIFGFLNTEDTALSSNFGLWDMIEALKWVNKNIAAFGGDPESVTIFGESAGGFAVSCLAVIPSTKGLFKRIIPQSGSAVAFMGIVQNPAKAVKSIGQLVGCITDEDIYVDNNDLVNCLKKKTPDELVKAQSEIQYFGKFTLTPAIWPSIDGELLRRSPLDSLNDPKSEESVYFRSLDMLTGTTNNDGSMSMMPAFLGRLHESIGLNFTGGIPTSVLCNTVAPTLVLEMFKDETIVSDLLCKEYSDDNIKQQSNNIVNLIADAWFVSPTLQLLDFHAKDKISPNTYQYLFTKTLNIFLKYSWMEGASHAAELPHMFGPKGINEIDASMSSDAGRAFTDVLVTYWTNFSKTGNPNGEGLVPWKAFTSKDRDYLQLKYQPVPRQNLYEKRMKFLLQDIPNKIRNNVKTEL